MMERDLVAVKREDAFVHIINGYIYIVSAGLNTKRGLRKIERDLVVVKREMNAQVRAVLNVEAQG